MNQGKGLFSTLAKFSPLKQLSKKYQFVDFHQFMIFHFFANQNSPFIYGQRLDQRYKMKRNMMINSFMIAC